MTWRKITAIILLLSFSGCLSPAFSQDSLQAEKLQQLETILLQLQSELNTLQNNYERQKITLSELQNELNSREALLTELETEITSLQTSLLESENDTQNLRMQLARVRSQLAEVRGLLNSALESLENYRGRVILISVGVGIVGFIIGLIVD